jgi:HD superfamily phosphodiesterase
VNASPADGAWLASWEECCRARVVSSGALRHDVPKHAAERSRASALAADAATAFLGAVGIARTLMLGGAMGKPLHDAGEPIPVDRVPDDHANVIDHFFVKLLHLEARMRTARGRAEAGARTQYMRDFLERLAGEIDGADAVR